MFSAVSTASHPMGAWQKHMLSLLATWPLDSRVTSGRLPDDMSEGNNVMFSLPTKRAIYLTKTPFQLNCKLHDIWMPLHMESDSCCDGFGVGIFSHWKTLHLFCCEGTISLTLGNHTFSITDWKKIWSLVGACPKKVNFRPCVLKAHHTIFPCVISPASDCVGKYIHVCYWSHIWMNHYAKNVSFCLAWDRITGRVGPPVSSTEIKLVSWEEGMLAMWFSISFILYIVTLEHFTRFVCHWLC